MIIKIVLSLLVALSLAAQSAPSSKISYQHFLTETPHVRPPLSNHIDAPLPIVLDSDQVLGIYGNILYPQDRELIQKKKLFDWIEKCGVPFPLSEHEIKEISFYILDRFPEQAFRWFFAKDIELLLANGDSPERALEKAEKQSLIRANLYREIAQNIPQWEGRCKQLILKLNECAANAEKILKRDIENLRTGQREALSKILQSTSPSLIEPPYDWETRTGVVKQLVDKVTSFSPNAPYFLALQEVTPQALRDLKKTFAERDLQWISFNNVSEEQTLEPGEENVSGEATAFTSTIALSRGLKVLKVELKDLPTESGSIRKILGVRILNSNTNETFDLFSTHTDHKIQNDIYVRTALKIHQFVTKFIQDSPNVERQPFVIGGDLNVFRNSGGARYVAKLRELFPTSRDFRETNYYAPSPIAWTTFIGRPDGYPHIPIEEDGTAEPNGLDQLLLKGLKIESSSREALVYNEFGKLLDYYDEREEYIKNLRNKVTFSDHFFNIVRFKSCHQTILE